MCACVQVSSWVVRYPVTATPSTLTLPLDTDTNPLKLPTNTNPLTPPTDTSPLTPPTDTDTLTHFNSSSPHLNAVYSLGRYTILATSLDVNTDSNTRQRDNCEMDAFIAAMGQLRTSEGENLNPKPKP